jgi:hypothetical protein
VAVRLPPELKEAIEERAEREATSVSEVIALMLVMGAM